MATSKQQQEMGNIFANFDRKQKAIHDNVKAFVTKAAIKVSGQAKMNCNPATSPYNKAPFETGNLQRSNFYVVYEEGDVIVGLVYNNADYAVFVHEGTSKMEGRPFLYDAISVNANYIRDGLKNAVEKGVKA